MARIMQGGKSLGLFLALLVLLAFSRSLVPIMGGGTFSSKEWSVSAKRSTMDREDGNPYWLALRSEREQLGLRLQSNSSLTFNDVRQSLVEMNNHAMQVVLNYGGSLVEPRYSIDQDMQLFAPSNDREAKRHVRYVSRPGTEAPERSFAALRDLYLEQELDQLSNHQLSRLQSILGNIPPIHLLFNTEMDRMVTQLAEHISDRISQRRRSVCMVFPGCYSPGSFLSLASSFTSFHRLIFCLIAILGAFLLGSWVYRSREDNQLF